jgi:hypothetical protein
MKNLIKSWSLIASMLFLSLFSYAQSDDATGLPGDHFDLRGALDLFKKASSPEEFEKLLNTESNHVNNLDLNEDGDIDYVKVIDNADGDGHAFILQVAVSENENQDIAVIELEKDGKESAIIQIIGDEDIYGESIIVEPNGDEDKKSNKKGPYMDEGFDDIVVVNVWSWPSVSFIYGPVYRPWVSPFRWAFYPTWWRPWRPLTWSVFHPFRVRYHSAFVIAPIHRTVRVHNVYAPRRVSSVTVTRRHSTAVNNYRVTRKTTTVHARGPQGGHVDAKRTTTKVTGPRGNSAKVTKTKVKRGRN